MAYEKQTWKDLPDTTTPITAERLNHIEDGIANSIDLDSPQTISGTKTFEEPIVLNSKPTEENHVARLGDIKTSFVYAETTSQPYNTNLGQEIQLLMSKKYSFGKNYFTIENNTIKVDTDDIKYVVIDVTVNTQVQGTGQNRTIVRLKKNSTNLISIPIVGGTQVYWTSGGSLSGYVVPVENGDTFTASYENSSVQSSIIFFNIKITPIFVDAN